MGANLAFVTTVTPLGNNFFISGKLIDVQTARIERQRTGQTMRGSNDLLSVVQTIGHEMFGMEQNSGQGSALLHIYRPWAYVGETVGIEIFLDGARITVLANQSKTTVATEQLGNITLSATFQNASNRAKERQRQDSQISIDVEPGRNYYIRVSSGSVSSTMATVNSFTGMSRNNPVGANPLLELQHNENVGKAEFDNVIR